MVKFLKKSIKILCICLIINFIFSFVFIVNNPINEIKEAINDVNQARYYAFATSSPQLKQENNNISYRYDGLIYHFNKDKMLVKICSTHCDRECYDYNGTFDYILQWYIFTDIIEIIFIFLCISLCITLPCFVIFIVLALFIKLIILKFL